MFKKIFFLAVVAAFFWMSCGNDNGGPTGPNLQPTITGITPATVSRGAQNIAGSIQGTNLTGVVTVNLGDGINILEKTPVSAVEISIKFSVSKNAPAGPHTITVTTSLGTATATTLFTVSGNHVPTASFTVTPAKGGKNTVFVFDATNSDDEDGSITGYKWDFGDNKKATGRTTTHKYASGGDFDITLTVTDDDLGQDSTMKSVDVANGLTPVARFTVSPEAGALDTVFTFDAGGSSDDGSISSYDWIFGDGAKAIGEVVTHKFGRSDVFTVALTVTDNDGLESETERDVRVEDFNEAANKAAIDKVIRRFFKRFAELDHLDAEVIVEDWSEDPDCPGRDHEIKIIKEQQELVEKTTADVIDDIDILIHENRTIANAVAIANFKYTLKDGTKGEGTATHDFELVFEGDQWLICNFTLVQGTGDVLMR